MKIFVKLRFFLNIKIIGSGIYKVLFQLLILKPCFTTAFNKIYFD